MEQARGLYFAQLSMIEQGRATWESSFAQIEANLSVCPSLGKYGKKNGQSGQDRGLSKGSYSSNKDRVWFCRDFQRPDGCNLKSGHSVMYNGRTYAAKHICARCWQDDKKELEHSESSRDCPHRR